MKDFWNARYASKEYAYGKEPNVFFKQTLLKLKPGRILLPAEGEGRNAVFAASIGWEVHAYDFSEMAFEKAMALATEKKVKINYQIASLSEIEFPDKFFDAIGLIYVQFPDSIRKSNHQQLIKFLAPKGNVILEAFSKNHPYYQKQNPKVGGPKQPSQLYDIEGIKDDFCDISLKTIKEEIIELSEGSFHLGKTSVIRMQGKK